MVKLAESGPVVSRSHGDVGSGFELHFALENLLVV